MVPQNGGEKCGTLFSSLSTPRFLMASHGAPGIDARTKLFRTIKEVFKKRQSQPIERVIKQINPILRGWVNYFRIGNSGRCFSFVQDWVDKKCRRHLMKAKKQQGFGWEKWSREWFNQTLGFYGDYKVRYYQSPKVNPVR